MNKGLMKEVAAVRFWALLFAIMLVVGMIGQLLEFEIFGLIGNVILVVFTFLLYGACKTFERTEDGRDFEATCVALKRFLVVQGVFYGLALLLIVLGLVAALVLPFLVGKG